MRGDEVLYVCCEQPMLVDTTATGVTQGGLDVVGAMVCSVCGSRMIRKGLTREADASARWSVAGSGRSINCGGIRLRAEGRSGDGVPELMQRLVKLPELEAEVVRLRTELESKPKRVVRLRVVKNFDARDGYYQDGLRVVIDGKLLTAEEYGGAPEDNCESRDYSWVKESIALVAKSLGADVVIDEPIEIEKRSEFWNALSGPEPETPKVDDSGKCPTCGSTKHISHSPLGCGMAGD